MSKLLELVKSRQMRADLPLMYPGDTVRVHARIIEGSKERIQVFEGVVIRIRRAQNATTMTVRRISHASIGVERTFLIHSPRIDRFEVVRRGDVRRAKLYYLRERQGKSARIKEMLPSRAAARLAKRMPKAAPTVAAAPAPVEAEAAVEVEVVPAEAEVISEAPIEETAAEA